MYIKKNIKHKTGWQRGSRYSVCCGWEQQWIFER